MEDCSTGCSKPPVIVPVPRIDQVEYPASHLAFALLYCKGHQPAFQPPLLHTDVILLLDFSLPLKPPHGRGVACNSALVTRLVKNERKDPAKQCNLRA